MIKYPDRFTKAIVAFDAAHELDPARVKWKDVSIAAELLYAQRMTDRLLEFVPDASEELLLAARCQHIRRWEIPRSAFPQDRKGYLQWRSEEKRHHARIAADVLTQAGYDPGTIARVQALVLKKGLGNDPDVQIIEDVACLVFVEYYLEEFATGRPQEKVMDILRKTLTKMSVAAKDAVGALSLSPIVRSWINDAIVPK